ncbi:MAG: hypothetical protein WCY05_07700, partial [Candidatus Omnitrophota bacterium]
MKRIFLAVFISLVFASSLGAWSNGWNSGPIVTDSLTATGGTISGTNITVGAGKTLDVSDGTLTLADLQITVAKVSGAAAT